MSESSETALAAQVRSIVEEAERAAEEIRADVEAAARARAKDLLAEAEADAAWIRKEAEARAERYLDDSAARLDDFVRQRMDRIAQISDDLIAAGEHLQARFLEAEQVRRSLEQLVGALAETADRLSQEAREPLPELEAMPVVRTPRPPTFTGASAPPRGKGAVDLASRRTSGPTDGASGPTPAASSPPSPRSVS